MRLVGITALAAVLVGVWPAHARAQTRAHTADAHLRRGLERYAARDYEGAIAEFKAGYALEPRRDFLFAMGQAERLSGDCPSAIVYYRRFLARTPNHRQRQAAWDNLRRCQRALSSGPGHTDPTAVLFADDTPPPAITKPPPAPVARPAWYRDPVAGALLVIGVVMVGVGGGFLRAAGSAEANAGHATTYQQYAADMSTAGQRRSIGVATIAAGGALLVGAVYRYITGRATATEKLAVGVSGTGAAVSFGGSF